MATLYHFPLCPFSRRVRLALIEIGYEVTLVEERPWNRREEFLIMNPAGTIPVLVEPEDRAISGMTAITEYLEEMSVAQNRRRLIPGPPYARAEIRRLVEWFDLKFNAEVTQLIAHEKINKRFMDPAVGGGGPNMEAIRTGCHNIRHHMQYIGYLTENRRWLAGDELSHADLAAAAHLSCIDFVDDVPWAQAGAAKDWYARIKSRPSFRQLLKDRLLGMAPPAHYEDPDF